MFLIEQSDEWLVQRRYVSEHPMRLALSEPVHIEPPPTIRASDTATCYWTLSITQVSPQQSVR